MIWFQKIKTKDGYKKIIQYQFCGFTVLRCETSPTKKKFDLSGLKFCYKRKKKVVCYSCCTGNYDALPMPAAVNPYWDYVFFTDNAEQIAQRQIGCWQIRPLVFTDLDNVKNARWHKINAHKLFPKYRASLYHDANIAINSAAVFAKVDAWLKSDVLTAIPLHPERNCIYAEADTIVECGIDYPETVYAETAFLRAENYPADNGLHETNIMFRKHQRIAKALDLWWRMVADYSKRDQLSLDYTMWKHHIRIEPFYRERGEHRTNGDFSFQYLSSHDQNRVVK